MGYISSQELAERLGLENDSELYQDIKCAARDAVNKTFNFNDTWKAQDQLKLPLVLDQITKKFPGVFKSSDPDHRQKMAGMSSYMATHWISVRCKIMRGDKKSKVNCRVKRRQRGSYLEPSLPPSQSASFPSSLADSVSQVNKSSASSSSTQSISAASLDLPTSSSCSSRVSTSPLILAQKSDDIPLPEATPSASQGSSLTLNGNPNPLAVIPVPRLSEYRVDEVAAFLGSCDPDMRFLLNSFIKFGCRTQELLKRVSTWIEKDIDEFLRKVVSVDPQISEVIPPMELHLLRRHFKEHFNE